MKKLNLFQMSRILDLTLHINTIFDKIVTSCLNI